MAERRNWSGRKGSRASSEGHVGRLNRAVRAGVETLERRLFLDATPSDVPARRALFPDGEPAVLFVAMGPYALTAAGPATTASLDDPTPKLISFTPTTQVGGVLDHIDLTFSKAMDPATFTLSADIVTFANGFGDLRSTITGATWQNGDTVLHVTFTPTTVEGFYQLRLGPDIVAADGSAGNAFGYFANFRYDAVQLQVVSVTPAPGSLIPVSSSARSVDFVVTFNEDISTSSVQTSDFAMDLANAGSMYFPDARTARFTAYLVRTEGTLHLTVPFGGITDAAANPGLEFTATYAIDSTDPIALPPSSLIAPAGSMTTSTGTSTPTQVLECVINTPTDSDSFLFRPPVFPGSERPVSMVVKPTSGSVLQPKVEWVSPSGTVLATATSAAAGSAVALQSVTAGAGDYLIRVSGAGGTTGRYTVTVSLGTTLEAEQYGGPSNNTRATAQDLGDAAFTTLDAAAHVDIASVLGSASSTAGGAAVVFADGFESGTLGPAWSTYTSDPAAGRIRVTGDNTEASGNFALWMDCAQNSDYTLNEAILTVDVSGVARPGLRFSQASRQPVVSWFPSGVRSYSGHINASGVSISADGIHWATLGSELVKSPPDPFASVEFDLAAAAAAGGIPLGKDLKIKFQEYTSQPMPFGGCGFDDVQVLDLVPEDNWYRLSLPAGASASIVATRQVPSNTLSLPGAAGEAPEIRVYDAAGALLTSGVFNDAAKGWVVSDLPGSASGATYYVRATSTVGSDYAMMITRGASIEVELNQLILGSPPTLQPSPSANGTQSIVGYIIPFTFPTTDIDLYHVTAVGGAPIALAITTPADLYGGQDVLLRPKLRLLDAAGNALPLSGGPGGLTYTTPAGAATDYFVEVTAAVQSAGPYVLKMSGHDVTPPFTAQASSPENGERITSAPSGVTIAFNDAVQVASLQASDLLVDGVAATGVKLADAETARFDVPPLAEGTHTLSIAAGAVLDIQGTPLGAMSSTFILDLLPPRVVGFNAAQGGTIAPTSTLTVTFSEGVKNPRDPFALTFTGCYNPAPVPTQTWDAQRKVLQLSFPTPLAEDQYTLTLLSGDYGFEDLVGRELDGEFPAGPLPAGGTGDGVPGGDFVVTFDVDVPANPAAPAFTGGSPFGGLIYLSTVNGAAITGASDTDAYVLSLDKDQQLSVVVEPKNDSLGASVQLMDPAGAIVANVTAPALGRPTVLQSVPITAAGNYRLTVTGGGGHSVGTYSLSAYLNAAVEAEEVGGAFNDSIATAQDLTSAFTPIPGMPAKARRAGVSGVTAPGASRAVLLDNFDDGWLGPPWTTYISNPAEGEVVVRPDATGKQFSMVMDQPHFEESDNEATWTIDLSGVASPTLSFNAAFQWDEQADPLPESFTDHAAGDGVSISTDGTQWYRLWQAATGASADPVTVDLVAAAQTAGITLGANTRIKFQQSGHARKPGGLAWDNVTILAPTTPDDYYSFMLGQGEMISLIAARADGAGVAPAVTLYDAAGTVLSTGVTVDSNVESGVFDFFAPAAGRYYVGVRAASGGAAAPATPYRLVVTAGATFEREPNSSAVTALPVEPTNVVLGFAEGLTDDWFRFSAKSGDVVTIRTATPGDGDGEFANLLYPQLELWGTTGPRLATGTTAPDGRNKRITATIPSTGWYLVHLSGLAGSPARGEYALSITGATRQTNLPGKPDLAAASDTGVSSTDDITNLNNATPAKALQITVPDTIPGATVSLYWNNTLIGSAVATGTTTVVTTSGSATLAEGADDVVARQTPAGGSESGSSLPLRVTVDSVRPAQPPAPVLTPTSDSGISSTDRITSVRSPTFTVNPSPYARVFRDGVRVSALDYSGATTFTSALLGGGTYAFTQVAVDAAGNESLPSDPSTILIDATPPAFAALDAQPLTNQGTTPYTFRVTFTDNLGIDPTSFDGNDVLVTGPGNFIRLASFVSVDNLVPGTPRTATYRVLPNDGSWDAADSGTYSVVLQPFTVKDIAGNLNTLAGTAGTFAVTIVTAPAKPVLAAGSDTGVSVTDALTRLNNASPASALQFQVGGTTAGDVVTLYADGVAIGSTTAGAGTSTVVTTDGATVLADGPHTITARRKPAAQSQPSPDSPPLTVTIDTQAPKAAVAYDPGRSARNVTVTLTEAPAAAVAGNALSVVRRSPNGGPDEPVAFDLERWDPATNSATFTVATLLADGNYRATFSSAGVADPAGNGMAADASADFFVLAGDADGDRTVGPGDFNLLASHFGQSGQTWLTGDFDGDGTVGPGDFNLLASRFGTTLIAPP